MNLSVSSLTCLSVLKINVCHIMCGAKLSNVLDLSLKIRDRTIAAEFALKTKQKNNYM